MATEVEPLTRRVPESVSLRTALLALLTVALWGANPVAVSYSVDTLPPIAVAAVRFALATLFMYFWCRYERSDVVLRTGQAVPALVAGVGMAVQIGTFNVGVAWSNSSHASMMINTFVFWVVLIEHFITRGDRLTARKLAGLILAFGGIVLLMATSTSSASASGAGPRDQPTLMGDAVLLLSAFVLAVKLVYVKNVLRLVEPGKLILWHNLFGTLLFLAYSLLFEDFAFRGLTTAATLGLLYQGLLVGGLCFGLQAVLLRQHSASQIAVFSFATPLFGVGLGILLRGDQLTPWLFVAAIGVAVGILLVNVRQAS